MTSTQAKQILLAYRPWAKDAETPEMAEALAVCQADPELEKWLKNHCETQMALRAKFQCIKAPEGLLEQIVSEQPSVVFTRTRPVQYLIAVAAGVVIMLSVWSLWRSRPRVPPEDLSFNGYQIRMTKTVSRAYGMDLETNNLVAIREYLAANQSPMVGDVPETLAQTPAVGCGVLRWQNKPVTMICFKTGKPLPPGAKSDLILFVINRQDVQAGSDLNQTQFRKVGEMFTASWMAGGKVFLLAAFDESELHKRI